VKIIGVYSIKGGVGKTATTVNLAYLSAASGHRTLVWDLDPQGAATYYFRVKPHLKGGGKALVTGGHHLDDLVKGTDFAHLDLLPADSGPAARGRQGADQATAAAAAPPVRGL